MHDLYWHSLPFFLNISKKNDNECHYKANEEVKERLEVAASYLDRVEAARPRQEGDSGRYVFRCPPTEVDKTGRSIEVEVGSRRGV